MKPEQFLQINGYSNLFLGWGGEDTDLYNRIKNVGLKITQNSIAIGRYKALKHAKAKPNPSRCWLLSHGSERYSSDGLNSVQYKILNKFEFPLFTWFYLDIGDDPQFPSSEFIEIHESLEFDSKENYKV